MVVTKGQQEKFQTLMRGTILSLCQNVLEHKSEIKVEVFFGVTVDKKQDFHFSVVETLSAVTVSGSTEVSKAEVRAPEAPEAPNPPPPPTHQSPSPSQPKHTPKSTPRQGSGSMLERLMTQGLPPTSPQADYYKRAREVSPSPRYRGREVTSSTVSDPSLSYSELLRSFGELSRQDSSLSSPAAHPQGSSYPILSANLSSSQQTDVSSHGSVTPQTPNYAIHSPTGHTSTATPVSRAAIFHPSAGWNDSTASPRTKKSRHKEPKKISPKEEDIPPDSTYSAGGESSSYGIKIKQEIMSDDEPDPQEAVSGFHPQNLMVAPQTQTSSGRERTSKDDSPSLSNDSSASSQGILMSLLCEKLPDARKRQGKGKKRLPEQDPPYNPTSKSALVISRKEQPELRDNRVLIGLTDYLPGFKEGDISRVRAPNIVFSAQDIIAKTRKVVLLNRGSFSTVRMVHRSLQGMKAYEISEIMQNMTRPRGHPEYVGEYKVVNMVKVRQGRKTIGVFYKCPPEFITAEALEQYDIRLEDYNKFYCHVFRYDRVPQPQYFEAILEASPYALLYDKVDHSWRPDRSYEQDTAYNLSQESGYPAEKDVSYDMMQNTPLDIKQGHYNMESEELNADDEMPLASTSQGNNVPEADSGTDVVNTTGLGLRITKVKTEQGEWDTDGRAFPSYLEAPGGEEQAPGPVTSTQRSWGDSPEHTESLAHTHTSDPDPQLSHNPELLKPSPDADSQMYPLQSDNEYKEFDKDCEDFAIEIEQDYDKEFGSGSAVYSQPVFPQPLVVEEGSSPPPQQH